MANREEPYDPYNKPRASQSSGDQRNEDWTNSGAQGGHRDQLAHIRDDLEIAKAAMLENVTLGQTRGVKAEDLDGKTENLQKSATDFQRRSHTVRREMWWKDMKMRICIVVGIIILLIVIIVPSVVASKHT